MLMPENVQLIKLIMLTNLSLLDVYYDGAHTSPMQKHVTKVAAILSSVRLSTASAFFTQGTVDIELIYKCAFQGQDIRSPVLSV